MNGQDQALSFLYMIGMLVLVGSAFAARRIPMGQGLRMFAAWILIFLVIFAGFTLKDDFIGLGKRILTEVRGEGQMVQSGQELRIRKSPDGHFWATARLNGHSVRFLVDSGATITSISDDTARRAGIEPSSSFPVLVDTANGTVSAKRGRAAKLVLGSIERDDLAVHISGALGETDLLGMNFLSSLSAWRVDGEWLVLKP